MKRQPKGDSQKLETAPREFVEAAFARAHRHIAQQCFQLWRAVQWFNTHRSAEPPIPPLVLDFTYDVMEREAARLAKQRRRR